MLSTRDLRVVCLCELKSKNNTIKATKTINLAFGKDIVNQKSVRRQFIKFYLGNFNLENETLSFLKISSTIKIIHKKSSETISRPQN